MNKIFLAQLIERLKTEKPKFFAKLQLYATVIIVLLGGVETLAYLDIIDLPEKAAMIIGGVIVFLTGNVAVAQLPNKDQNQK